MICHPLVAVCWRKKSLKTRFDCVLASSCSVQLGTPRHSHFGAKLLFNYECHISHLGICYAAVCRIQVSKGTLSSCRYALPGFVDRRFVRVAVPHDPTTCGAGRCGVPVSLGPRAGAGLGARCPQREKHGAGLADGSEWEAGLVWVRSVKPQLIVGCAPFLNSGWHGYFCTGLCL